jgi:ComF family protein
MKPNSLIQSVYTGFTDLLFPPVCWLCDSLLPESSSVVCCSCFSQLECYLAESDEFDDPDFLFENLYILFEFNAELRTLIHLFKYQGCSNLAGHFAREAERKLRQQDHPEYDFIIAVPLHQARLRERGYNQSALIAKQLADLTGIPAGNHILQRTRHTKTQTRFNRQERIKNMQGAFICSCKLNGKKILLIDDVITTGSTVNECSHALYQSGVSSVDVLALANPRLGD